MEYKGTFGPITVDGTASNMIYNGLSKGTLVKFSGFDKNLLNLKVTAPALNVNGSYKAKAVFIGIPINGDGKIVLNLSELQ
jgi:Haemolymph juvenile hormone binding protein (JHBP)